MAGNSKTVPSDELSKKTSIFGLHLWVVIGIGIGAAFVLLLVFISLWFISRRKSNNARQHSKPSHEPIIPNISRDIKEIHSSNLKPTLQESEHHAISIPAPNSNLQDDGHVGFNRIQVETGIKDHMITYPEQPSISIPQVSHLGWGNWYTLRELEDATDGFTDENVIGEGGYGIVYHGVLEDHTQVAVKNLLNNRYLIRLPKSSLCSSLLTDTQVAVKNLLNNRGQAEREFKVEVEAIGRVRHKNLVRLHGYCVEGSHRMLVYEYVDNGNLEQWLHGDVGPFSPLTWETRMNIILGTAKGLMYLHEGLEPKVVHRDIKASNILLDKQWNPKVSDFGLAKLMAPERTYVTTRVMGTFGYVAPEYAQTGMLNERSDVYSFGILIMEIISGRKPIDYSRPPGEVNLVEWLKVLVSNKNSEGVLDPKLPEQPSSRALKRALLVALRCVDPDSTKRPKMGHVINMLEVDDFPYRDDPRPVGRQRKKVQDTRSHQRLSERNAEGSDCNSGSDTSTNH